MQDYEFMIMSDDNIQSNEFTFELIEQQHIKDLIKDELFYQKPSFFSFK